MRFFRRDSGTTDGEAIDTFWRWWSEERDAIAAAIADRTLDLWVEPIGRQVQAIDRRLAWELAAGVTAQHALVVTPEGDPAVRPRALDWLRAAPPVDATWEYYAARQPRDLGTLELGGLSVDLTDFRAIAGWDEGRERLDVRLWHPALATAPQNLRLQTSFLYLDTLLGEEDVERWVGEIDVLDDPTGGWTPDELRAEVQRRATEATGASWALATVQDGRDAAVVVLNLAVKPIDHPYCQHHLTVTVARGLEQLAGPGEAEAAKLDAAEDRLAADLAPADAVHLGRITRRRDRVFHFMVRDPDAARAIATAWAGSEPQWSPRIDVTSDPAWEVRRQLGM